MPVLGHDFVVLTGPTGSGKSELGLELAERMDAEIIALDSMTLYRGMDIGTAKPSLKDRRRVTHHLIDRLDPWESSSVAWWLDKAVLAAEEIRHRGKRVLFVGGTALYLKALLFGLFDAPAANEELRRRLLACAQKQGPGELHRKLAQIDPVTASRVHENDLRRVIRALEVYEQTGRPMSAWQTQWQSGFTTNAQVFWINRPRAELYARIDQRVLQMIHLGWVKEAERLRALPRQLSKEAAQALGYKEVFAFLDGRTGLPECIQLIQTRSRQFAKRQCTWFRHIEGCQAVGAELTEVLARVTMTV
jgi:tRNA dimethylallyltransferase